jgi:lipid II:glycine glycyltransferase (peptidoglycan interpeptide bridge formation enzyme)
MFKATYDNEIQGAIIIFFDKTTAYYEFGGSIDRPIKGSLKAMHLKAMEYLNKEYGIKKYDFIGAVPDIIEGSKEAGIQKFKKEFGSELIEGYQFSLIIRPIKYYMYYYLLKMKLKLKGISYEDAIERNKQLSKSRLEI